MTTEQARKEIVEETLSNRDELRRALIEGLENDIGDGFLQALILLVENFQHLKNTNLSGLFDYVKCLLLATEDIAVSYANSVNIEEEL